MVLPTSDAVSSTPGDTSSCRPRCCRHRSRRRRRPLLRRPPVVSGSCRHPLARDQLRAATGRLACGALRCAQFHDRDRVGEVQEREYARRGRDHRRAECRRRLDIPFGFEGDGCVSACRPPCLKTRAPRSPRPANREPTRSDWICVSALCPWRTSAKAGYEIRVARYRVYRALRPGRVFGAAAWPMPTACLKDPRPAEQCTWSRERRAARQPGRIGMPLAGRPEPARRDGEPHRARSVAGAPALLGRLYRLVIAKVSGGLRRPETPATRSRCPSSFELTASTRQRGGRARRREGLGNGCGKCACAGSRRSGGSMRFGIKTEETDWGAYKERWCAIRTCASSTTCIGRSSRERRSSARPWMPG